MNQHLIDPTARLRGIVTKALSGCAFESSERSGPAVLVLHVRRGDGRLVHLRFRGVKESSASSEPAPGSPLAVKGVGSATPFWSRFLPVFLRTASQASRVRIDAGAARLEIVCEDVEWWEDGA